MSISFRISLFTCTVVIPSSFNVVKYFIEYLVKTKLSEILIILLSFEFKLFHRFIKNIRLGGNRSTWRIL